MIMLSPGSLRALALGLMVPAGASCDQQRTEHDDTPAWSLSLESNTPAPFIPENSPLTPARIALGRALFYDRRLSADASMSCATCHRQDKAFTDGRARAEGIDGDLHPLNTPSLANVVFAPRLGWADPRPLELEEQAEIPMFGVGAPIRELGLDSPALRAAALAQLRTDRRYAALFTAVWGDPEPTWPRIQAGLGSFQRTLISQHSPWDHFVRGDASAISEAARRGSRVFFGHETDAACHHCHGGFTFTGQARVARGSFDEVGYFNIGLYNLDDRGSYPSGAQGLFEANGDPKDRGKFRTPTLRNVEVTGPYMHDGSIARLEDVVMHYQNGGRSIEEGEHRGDGRLNPLKDSSIQGMRLSERERSDLVAFLRALTDDQLLHDPALSNPYPGDPFFGP